MISGAIRTVRQYLQTPQVDDDISPVWAPTSQFSPEFYLMSDVTEAMNELKIFDVTSLQYFCLGRRILPVCEILHARGFDLKVSWPVEDTVGGSISLVASGGSHSSTTITPIPSSPLGPTKPENEITKKPREDDEDDMSVLSEGYTTDELPISVGPKLTTLSSPSSIISLKEKKSRQPHSTCEFINSKSGEKCKSGVFKSGNKMCSKHGRSLVIKRHAT